MKKLGAAALFVSAVCLAGLSSCSKDGNGNGPSISAVTPSSVLTGAMITITGNRLAGATVEIGGIATQVFQNTESSVETIVPAGLTAGQHEVRVATADGSATSSINVTGAGAGPVITSIAPSGGAPIGGTITITGTGLLNGTVEIATKIAQVISSTPTTIQATVPNGIALGAASVRVTTSLGTTVSGMTVIP